MGHFHHDDISHRKNGKNIILKISVVSSFHSFIRLFVFAINHKYNNNIPKFYLILEYTILTKLFTKSNILSGNGKKAYIEAGGL